MTNRRYALESLPLWATDDPLPTPSRPSTRPARPHVPDPEPAPVPSDPNRPALVLLLSIEDTGKALGVCRSKIYELISRGDLEVVHIDRSARIPIDAIRSYVHRLRAS